LVASRTPGPDMATPAGAAADGSAIGTYRSAGQRASVRLLDGVILRSDPPQTGGARMGAHSTATFHPHATFG
jgi:hypothetical protein